MQLIKQVMLVINLVFDKPTYLYVVFHSTFSLLVIWDLVTGYYCVVSCHLQDGSTYLHMTLPLDLLWQGLICREQATAFHISGRHFLMSSTGMCMKGILIVPLDHSLMSFMAPWSDWTLQLRNSSVGLWTETRSQCGIKINNDVVDM